MIGFRSTYYPCIYRRCRRHRGAQVHKRTRAKGAGSAAAAAAVAMVVVTGMGMTHHAIRRHYAGRMRRMKRRRTKTWTTKTSTTRVRTTSSSRSRSCSTAAAAAARHHSIVRHHVRGPYGIRGNCIREAMPRRTRNAWRDVPRNRTIGVRNGINSRAVRRGAGCTADSMIRRFASRRQCTGSHKWLSYERYRMDSGQDILR